MAVDYGVCMGKLSRNGISGQESKKKRRRAIKEETKDVVISRWKSKLTGKETLDGEGDGGRGLEELKRSSLEWNGRGKETEAGEWGRGKGDKYRRATLSQESCGRAPNC